MIDLVVNLFVAGSLIAILAVLAVLYYFIKEKPKLFYTPLSGILIASGDVLGSGVPILGGLTLGVVFPVVIFLVQFYQTKAFFSALILGLVAGAIIAVPTPILGLGVGGYAVVKKLNARR